METASDGASTDSGFGPSYALNQDEVLDPNSIRAISEIRENIRGWLALLIVIALLLIVVFSYGIFIVLFWKDGEVAPTDLKDLTEALLSPVIGIVGAVTGFYFGEKYADRSR